MHEIVKQDFIQQGSVGGGKGRGGGGGAGELVTPPPKLSTYIALTIANTLCQIKSQCLKPVTSLACQTLLPKEGERVW